MFVRDFDLVYQLCLSACLSALFMSFVYELVTVVGLSPQRLFLWSGKSLMENLLLFFGCFSVAMSLTVMLRYFWDSCENRCFMFCIYSRDYFCTSVNACLSSVSA